MGTRATRMPCGPGPLFWPLLLLLPIKPSIPNASKVSGIAPGRPQPQQGWEPSASRNQYPVNRPVCGKPKMVGKVFGGQDTLAGQWPWQASLLYRGVHLCGAVLIDTHWLASTAHCFRNKSQAPEDYEVLLGNNQLYQETKHTQKISVNHIVSHPDFEKFHSFGSDIAMLQLHLPINFTSYVVPACLPSKDTQLSNHTSCWITAKLLPPFSLQEGEVGIIDNEFCNALYGQTPGQSRNYVYEEMLCAGGLSTGKSICRGDSGGPLICYHNSTWVLVGLASWGLDCRHPIYPSVFTRVAYFTDWISQVKRLTPLPEPVSVSLHTELQPTPLKAAGSPQPCNILMAAQIWFLMLFILEAPQWTPE
ncbi:protease, serine 47 isoform X2 [Mus musculus]|uniref:protease, serine 47 isoform X2 n=1 Tax=Mus musculus TaxID=10090 RepID=UPI0003D718D7|nr:protease, serine 47 isoform X2 [Mus musculus]|eukprot:XP_006517556.1 PREDICTED: putative serine protease 47 isoform X2 [Mus musculus]